MNNQERRAVQWLSNEIKQIHDYEVAEISYYEIKNASKEFFDWIDKNIL